MIYTVTLNPALDYVVQLADPLAHGQTNRAAETALLPGGKGLNVARVLAALGQPCVPLAFVAGQTGELLAALLAECGLDARLLRLPGGSTRINVKLKDGAETELNAPGAAPPPAAMEWLAGQLDALQPGDTLVLSGSLPAALPPDTYARLLRPLAGRGVRAVVDAEGEALRAALGCRPFLVKPNRAELEQLAGRPLPTDADLTQAARALQAQGAANVLVSLGAQGALLQTQGGAVLRAAAPAGRAVNSVGAGDSMVAGFLAGLAGGGQPADALRLAVAAGSATAFARDLADGAAIRAAEAALRQAE